MIPAGHTIEDIKTRERIIRDFYREWKEKNPSQRKFNLSLKEYINIRMVSIVETSEHAAKNYLSTLAVLQLDSILTGARKVSVKKPKPMILWTETGPAEYAVFSLPINTFVESLQ